MIAKMTKDGVIQVYAETEAEIYMLKCWEKNCKESKGAAFETFASFEQKPGFIPQFSTQPAKLTGHELSV